MNSVSTNADRGFLVKAATLSIIVIEYSISILTPTLASIAAAFPDVSTDAVKLLTTVPNFTMMIFAFLVGPLTKIFKKRTLLIIAMLVMFASSIAPAFGGGFAFIMASRILFGMGRGIVFPFAMSMIIELFEGKTRDKLMGWRSTTGSISGIIYQLLAGVLATIFWRYTFLVSLVMVIPILLIIWKLPEPPKANEAEENVEKGKKNLSKTTWIMIISNMIFMFFAYSFMTNMALCISYTGVGTAANTGTVVSTFTATSACCGLIFGVAIRPLFKKQTITVGMLFIGAALTFLSMASTLGMFFIGAILFGIGFSVYNTALYLDLGESASRSAASFAMGILMACNAMGQFLSPIILAFLRNILGLSGELAGWQIAGPVILAATVIVFIVKVFGRKKNNNPNLTEGTQA